MRPERRCSVTAYAMVSSEADRAAQLGSQAMDHQHTAPLFLDRLEPSGTARALERLSFASRAHDESWLQELIYRFPQSLPVAEIEPAFGSLVSVCRELPTSVGSVDNVYITENGNLAIAECKLWKNPQARREVVTQILDYAHSMARWSYKDLEDAVQRRLGLEGKKLDGGLFSLASDNTDMEEHVFCDAVSRNLRLGRMLLLLVGDGIREGVETLSKYLQEHAGFHFTLGIVEMAVFKMPDHGFLVHPRILARTVHIERGIVRIDDSRISVEPMPKTGVTQPRTISEDQLREKLKQDMPDVSAALERAEKQVRDLDVFVEAATKSLVFRWSGPDDVDYALAGVGSDGTLRTMFVNYKPNQIGKVDLSHEYLAKVAALMGKRLVPGDDPKGWRVTEIDGGRPPAIDLLSRPDEWLEIIRWYTSELSSALTEASK